MNLGGNDHSPMRAKRLWLRYNKVQDDVQSAAELPMRSLAAADAVEASCRCRLPSLGLGWLRWPSWLRDQVDWSDERARMPESRVGETGRAEQTSDRVIESCRRQRDPVARDARRPIDCSPIMTDGRREDPLSATEGLRELNNYLRREKEILEEQYEMKEKESTRLQQKLHRH